MRIIEKVSYQFWEEVARACPYATFFHTHYWAEVIEKSFICANITKGFVFEDGTRVVFPLILIKKRYLKGSINLNNYISGMLFVYGGPIADKDLTKQQLDEIMEYINSKFSKYDEVIIRGNPYCQNIKPYGFKEVKDSSHVVELFMYKNEEDLIKKNYHKQSKRHIIKAKKSNLLTIKTSYSSDEYERLYFIYKKSFRYWKVKPLTNYPLSLFRNLCKLKCKYKKLWVAYYKNKIIGGEIILYWNDFCTSFLPYFDKEYSKYEGRRYTEHNIFLDCIEKKIKYYDYLQSGGIKGLEFYKSSMGGKEYSYSSWVKKNKILKKIRYIKNKVKIA